MAPLSNAACLASFSPFAPVKWRRMAEQNGAILDVQGLTKTYPTSDDSRRKQHYLTVLRDITFTLARGDTCAILGPSGSGKTTLLGLCAGLDIPSSGRVSLAGSDLASLTEDGRAELRGRVSGFVFQNFQLIPTITALENVMVPMELRGLDHPLEEAIQLLGRVGLSERLHHYPAQLSGGEQQRVAIARAFINRPQILFADEPTGNLDAETSHRIVELLFNLNTESGTALVLVTHDQELAGRARTVIRLKGGTMVS
jgi:putative ABC transport system ATP-binding protein